MKNFVKAFFEYFDFTVQRKSLLERSEDPIQVCELIHEGIDVKTIIDGGASIGTLTQKISNSFPNAYIHAFEPFQDHFNELQKVACKNNYIIPVDKALSDQIGTRTFFLNQEGGTNSLLQSTSEGQAIYGKQLKEKGRTEVECVSLDYYLRQHEIESVDLLKLDLQGGEVDALRGATRSLHDGKIKCIICEVMFERHYNGQPTAGKLLFELIENFGFILLNFYQSNHHRGKLIYSDALLIHPSRLAQIEKRTERSFHAYSKLPL